MLSICPLIVPDLLPFLACHAPDTPPGIEAMGGSYLQPVEVAGFAKDASVSTLTISAPDGEIAYGLNDDLSYWSSGEWQELDGE